MPMPELTPELRETLRRQAERAVANKLSTSKIAPYVVALLDALERAETERDEALKGVATMRDRLTKLRQLRAAEAPPKSADPDPRESEVVCGDCGVEPNPEWEDPMAGWREDEMGHTCPGCVKNQGPPDEVETGVGALIDIMNTPKED